jgi:hypothetical protein
MVIADIVTTGGGARNVASPALLAASSELPMPNLSETRLLDLVGGGGSGEKEVTDNPMHRCNAAPRCQAKSKRTGLPCRSPAVKGSRVCRMHGARGGAPEGKRNGNYRNGTRTKEAIQAVRYINLLSRLARNS